MDKFELAPTKLEDVKAEVQNPLLEVNLSTEVSGLLNDSFQSELISLLHGFHDCFT